MKWRFLALCAGLLQVSAVLASFDLILLQATNIESGDLGPRVHRFDPINNLSLGSFVLSTPSVMAASSATGELYTMDVNGGYRAYDYSTGERKRTIQTIISGITDIAVNPVDGRIFVVNGSNLIYTLNRLTGAVTTVASRAGSTYTKIALSNLGSGNLFAWNSTSNNLDRFTGSPTNYTFQGTTATFGSSPINQMAVSAPSGGTTPYVIAARGTTMSMTSTTAPDLLGTSFQMALTNHLDYRVMLTAHDGYYAIGNDAVSGGHTRITGMDGLNYYAVTRSLAGVSGGVRNAAIVLAPEPWTFTTLALALVAVRRRKSR